MKKIIMLIMLTSLLNACSSTPSQKPGVNGTLKDQKIAKISFQKEPAKTSVQFNTTGYTIFGAIYVAAAVSQMNENTEKMQKAYQNYLAKNPSVPSLEETYKQSLIKYLASYNVEVDPIEVTKKVSDNVIEYQANPNDLDGHHAVVNDGLLAQFFAESSTDDYHPRAGVLVSVLDKKDPSKIILQQEIVNIGPEAYPNFEAIKADPDKAYRVLQETVKNLAKKVVDTLITISQSQKAA